MPRLSVIIPVKNEAASIPPLAEAVRLALGGLDYELIWVDDGSTDSSRQRILENRDDHTLLVELEANYGQSAAMMAGFRQSRGRFIAFLDGDGQNDPTDIPPMLFLLESGNWDLVAGHRKNRKDGFLLRKIPSRIANALIRRVTGVRISDYGCTLKIIRREIAEKMELTDGMHRFIPVLAARCGARITEMAVKHHPRIHGKSKYGLSRTFKVIRDLYVLRSGRRNSIPAVKKNYTVRIVYGPGSPAPAARELPVP